MCGRKRRPPRLVPMRRRHAGSIVRRSFRTGGRIARRRSQRDLLRDILDYDELELALGAKMELSKVPTICSLACEFLKVDCHPA